MNILVVEALVKRGAEVNHQNKVSFDTQWKIKLMYVYSSSHGSSNTQWAVLPFLPLTTQTPG